MQVYNSLGKNKQEFTTITPGVVRMYVCGVTVYDDPHIGHARCYVAFDAIHRHLKAKGYKVQYVRNFTDIDDKIINRAAQTGQKWQDLTAKYIKSFTDDMNALKVLPATIEPKATENIDAIINLITCLIDKGHAYVIDDKDVYFSVRSFPIYGQLSGRSLDEMLSGVRVEIDERKQDSMDFALWKAAKPGEPAWPSPWGSGRPGWHIECSAMSERFLGSTFDIHGGGNDLLFPHHENEKAQSEACSGHLFARYWLHNGFVQINQEKMSKSEGNFFTIKEILDIAHPEAIRLFLLGSHYRSPIEFSDQALTNSSAGLNRLYTALLNAQEAGQPGTIDFYELQEQMQNFENAMDDDFNTAAALASLFNIARMVNRLSNQETEAGKIKLYMCAQALLALGARLGVLEEDPAAFRQSQGKKVDENIINKLIEERNQARAAKDFTRADAIRNQLLEMKVALEDTPQGTKWRLQ